MPRHWLTRFLLKCYHRRFRERFGAGMMFAWEEERRAARATGRTALVWFWIHTSAHAALGGLVERFLARRHAVTVSRTRQSFGDVVAETVRELRIAVRRLARSPAYVMASVGALALGIGATTAIFSVVQGVILEPLPYDDPDEVVLVGHVKPSDRMPNPSAAYHYYAENAQTLEEFAVYIENSVPITGTGEPLEFRMIVTTPELFSILGATTILGRVFTEEDMVRGAPSPTVLTYGFWMSHFGGDQNIIGQPVTDSSNTRIVGVLSPNFQFVRPEATITFGSTFDSPHAFVPMRLDRANARFGNFIYQGVARLADGVTPDAAISELEVLMPLAAEAYPGGHTPASLVETGYRPLVQPFKDIMVGHMARILWILMGAVAVVFFMATANVANLFAVRADARRQEIGVRLALGASGTSLTRAFLSESVLLAGAGGLLGIVFAAVGLRALLALAPPEIPRIDQVGINLVVLGFGFGISILAGLAFGLIPRLRFARFDLAGEVGGTSRGGTVGRERQRTRWVLVATQVAFALILLVGSGLMLRTFDNLRRVEPGFEAANALTLKVALPGSRYPGPRPRTDFLLGLTERLEGLPGVVAASFGSDLPFDGNEWRDRVGTIESFAEADVEPPFAMRHYVGPTFFRTMGATIFKGREPVASDYTDPVHVVVNASFAQQRWPNDDPIGKRIIQWDNPQDADVWYTVVGVVGDMRETSLTTESEPTIYLPTVLRPDENYSMFITSFVVLVRTVGDPYQALPTVVAEIQRLDPEVPIGAIQSLEQVTARSTQEVSFAMVLLVIAALVSLALGIIGIYGVVAYVVSQRTREFGVRLALGANARDVRRLVLRQGTAVAVVGISFGLAGAVVVSRVLESLLFGVVATDTIVYGVVSVLLFGLVLGAALIPAQRATRINPLDAIRTE